MKRRRGILAALLFAAACLAAVPAGRVRAADQKVVTRTISRTRFEKVKNSSQNGLHVGNAGSSFHTVTFGSYTAICTGIDTQVNDTHFYDDPTLQITKDGTSYRNIDLESFVQKKARISEDSEIAFYHARNLNGALFITGAYGYTDAEDRARCQYFFLRAKTDRDLTYYKLNKDLAGDPDAGWNGPAESSWNLYLSKGKYVAAMDQISLAKAAKNGSTDQMTYGIYYVSANLKSWTEKRIKQTQKLPAERFPTVAFRPMLGTPTGMVFMERQIYNEYGDNWLIYTTNFSSYRRVSGVAAGNGYKNGTEKMIWFDLGGASNGNGSEAILARYTLAEGRFSNLELYRMKGIGSVSKILSANGSWQTYRWIATTDWKKLCIFVRTAKGNSLYVGGKSGSPQSVSTKLDARKIALGDCDTAGNLYFLYNSRYIMASRNFGKNVYQIDTGIGTLEACFVCGDRLVLVNGAGSDVSIPLTQIKKVMT